MKKVLPFLAGLLFVALVFAVNFVYAQDSTSSSTSPAFTLPGQWGYWVGALIALYELFVRYVPTAKSWSVATWLFRFLRFLVPDRSAKGPNHA